MNGFFTYVVNSLGGQKEIFDGYFVCQYSVDYTKHAECGSAQLVIMCDDSYETICDNCNINLYPHSILRVTPEGGDAEMLLYPPKKQFYLPALLVQHSGVFHLDVDAVGQERECSRLMRNLIHHIPILNFCFRDMKLSRYLGYYVKQCVNFDATLVFSEVCPLEQAQAKVYRGVVESTELSRQFKRSVNSFALSKINHEIGKLFKYLVVPVHIGIGKVAQFNLSGAKSEMVALVFDRINDARELSEGVTGSQLPIHHNQQLVPAGECLHPFVSVMSLNNHIKNSLGQEIHKLTEYIFVAVHICLGLFTGCKMQNEFKSTRDFFCF